LHALLGVNLGLLDQQRGARWQLEYACALKPELTPARLYLGQLLVRVNDVTNALPHLAAAVNLTPNDLETRRTHALALQQTGQGALAVQAWRTASQLAPGQPDLLNNLAWLLATDPDDSVRNGAEAVTLAQRACELTERQQPALLGTLAAAYAEAGQFPEAIRVAEEAVALAQRLGLPEIEKRNRELRELYRAGRTTRASPAE
jgi:Flp pilus assembly protein TadD